MDAVQLLLQDHERVKNLFLDFELAPLGQPDHRRAMAEKILRELMVHERIEEEIFYPAFRRAMGAEGKEEVQHAKDEHAEVDSLIAALEGIRLDDKDFDRTMREIKEKVLHHVQEEETKMLPMARERMGTDLLGLAGDMLEYKDALLRELREGSAEGRKDERARSAR